ncbi:MAG: amino acid adenylation domain-containing protein [Myxococcales bacterium]|nr:amino acid adenylation domain-containing protein [Myxococcales bacterium]
MEPDRGRVPAHDPDRGAGRRDRAARARQGRGQGHRRRAHLRRAGGGRGHGHRGAGRGRGRARGPDRPPGRSRSPPAAGPARRPRRRRRVRAARPQLPGRAPAVHGRGRARRRRRHHRRGPRSGRARPGPDDRDRRARARHAAGGRGRLDRRRRLRHLHVGLDRHPQGRAGPAPHGRQPDHQRRPRARPDRGRRRARGHDAVVRHRGVRADRPADGRRHDRAGRPRPDHRRRSPARAGRARGRDVHRRHARDLAPAARRRLGRRSPRHRDLHRRGHAPRPRGRPAPDRRRALERLRPDRDHGLVELPPRHRRRPDPDRPPGREHHAARPRRRSPAGAGRRDRRALHRRRRRHARLPRSARAHRRAVLARSVPGRRRGPAVPHRRSRPLAHRASADGGALECLGRTDFQIKLRGYRIELGEIEVALARHPAVAQAAVTTREDRPGDVRLIAYLVPAAGAAVPADDDLRAHLARTLPDYMIPSRFVALAALPLTGSGKVDRKALPAPSGPAVVADGPAVAPRTPLEERLARGFADALAVARLSIHDDFFALGGHSLLVAQLAARLGKELGRAVPMRAVFEHPTVARLAAWLGAQAPAGAVALPVIPRRADVGPAPLSLMQQRVWYLEQLQLGRTVFNVPSAHRLRGALDRPALERAIATLVQRQDVLRTVIRMVGDSPAQVVLDDVDVAVPFEDLTGAPTDARAAVLDRRLAELVAVPFDLAVAPLFRTRLFKLADDEHVLFFMPHHAIWDGWSFDLFYEEMADLYGAYQRGAEPSRPPPPVTYADFSVWHRDWMAGPELERQLAHWQAALAGAPESLDLPTDHPRPPTMSGAGDTEWLRLPPAVTDGLRAAGLRESATLFMTLLGAWTVLLHQQTRQRELVIGTPVRGRNVADVEQVAGFFVNALPLRLAVDPDRSFLELVRGVRARTIEAFGAQDVPFEHLVRTLDVRRDESRFPIYQAFFSYQDARQRPPRWGNLDHRNLPVFQPAAAQDVALWFLDGTDGVVGGLNYNTDILTADTAQRLARRFLALVAAIAAHPERPVRELLAITDDERAQLDAWNATATPPPPAPNLAAYVAPGLARDPTKVAIRSAGGATTYGELAAQRDRIAAALVARGVGRGAVVALHLERGPAMVAALLGVAAAGATYLPLDPAFPRDRLAFMLADSGAHTVVADRDLADLGVAAAQVLRLDGDPLPDAGPGPATAATADDAAYLIYTSGSTGQPKGVAVPHRAVTNFLASMAARPGLTAADRLCAVTTLSFDIAALELWLPLAIGAEIVLASRDQATDGHALRALLEESRATIMQATPATWRMLVEAGWRGGAGFTALCGGEALPVELAEALLERTGALWNMYGPTETTVWSTCARIEPGQGDLTIGTPIANTTVWVVDDAGQPVPIGVPGELAIGGLGVALGYHNRPELTAERFVPDRFAAAPDARLYRTGDLGRWRADGTLQHLGRTDLQVKIRGYRIELGEIEVALARHPRIAQAAVVAGPGPGGEQRLIAYLVASGGDAPAAAALRENLRDALPDYMIPAVFVPLPALPLTPNGKVDRRALPAPTDAGAAPVVSYAAPRDAMEQLIAQTFADVLEIPQVGVDDDFFALGGHSLLVARVTIRLSSALGWDLPMRAPFTHPTTAGLSRWIFANRPTRLDRLALPKRTASTPPPLSLAQQRAWYLEELQGARPLFNMPAAFGLRGDVDRRLLQRALDLLLERHAALRTSIGLHDGVPFQAIAAHVSVPIDFDDLTTPVADGDVLSLTERLDAEAARPFDIGIPPLLRANLWRTTADEHVFMLVVHHAIFDGTSLAIILEELGTTYVSLVAGETPTFPSLPVTYADFSEWHRMWMTGPELERQLAYWKGKLAGAPESLDLPTDFPRPATMTGNGATEWIELDDKTSAELRALASQHSATPFMVLLAAWAVFLSQLTRQSDLVIGTPVHGRVHPDLARVVGFFANAIPLRFTLDVDQSFSQLVAAVRVDTVEAFGAQDVPFEHLVRVVDLVRDPSRSPIYQAFLAYQDRRARVLRWGELELEALRVFPPAAMQDLALWLTDTSRGMVGSLNYNTDILTADTAQRLARRFLALVTAIAAHPERPVRELLAITEDERAQLDAWNATATPPPTAANLAAYVAPGLARDPAQVAIRCAGAATTYGELAAQRDRIAAALRARGVGRGAVVALHLERGPAMIAALLGVAAAGATYLPLDPAFPRDRLAFMLADSGAHTVVADRDLADLGVAAAQVLRLDGDPLPEAGPGPASAATADDAAYLIYTSGSTGLPKGVAVPHRAVTNFLASMAARPGLTAADRLCAVTTLSFDIAVLELWLPLAVGAEIILASRDQATDGHALRALLEEARATIMQATPATWRMLVEAGWRGGAGFTALCGGEALPVELAEALLERTGALWNMYGPTETTVWSTCARIEPGQGDLTIGTPIANTTVWVVDDAGQPVPIGVPGELAIGGLGVALGYHNRPELTAERFVPDRFAAAPDARLYRTGDLGRWRADGTLQHLGRTDFQVKIRGYRIELGEIEVALARHPRIAQAAVVAGPGPGGEQRLIAYLVASGGDAPAAAALREHLRDALPDYMIPAVFVPLPALPLTPNGKVDRRALPAPTDAGAAPVAGPYAGPRTPAENLVADVWKSLLGAQRISIYDNFLDLGGHSLLVMQAIAKLEQRTGKRVSPRAFFFHNLEQLAREYESALAPPSGPKPPRPPEPPAPTSRLRRLWSALKS